MKNLGTNRIKKSYSISPEAEQFVRRMRKARKVSSDSETLDQLLHESMQAHSRGAVDAAYKSYYDAAPAAAVEEELVWGAFSESEMARLTK